MIRIKIHLSFWPGTALASSVLSGRAQQIEAVSIGHGGRADATTVLHALWLVLAARLFINL